ncbi:MAG: metal-dependent hydrolase [Gemmataceae bacterium]
MANFQTHVGTAAILGAAYGAAGTLGWHLDWGLAFLAAGLCTLGGMLPDLDSDSGRPVRELSILAGFIFPILLIPRLRRFGLSLEQGIVIVIGAHFLIRYALAAVIRRTTVHRGMFHSLPALAISGLVIFLVYHNENLMQRCYVAVAVMVGFLSHLLLDELYAVNFNGVAIKLNQFAGSAVKLRSSSWKANLFTYALLAGLGYLAWDSLKERGIMTPRDLSDAFHREVVRPGR